MEAYYIIKFYSKIIPHECICQTLLLLMHVLLLSLTLDYSIGLVSESVGIFQKIFDQPWLGSCIFGA